MSAGAPTWLLIGIPIICFVVMIVGIVGCACVAAGRADDRLEVLLHSEEQEGRAAAGGQAPLVSLAAARALGNATGTPGLDKARRPQVLTVQRRQEVSCSSVVVDIDEFRGRR